MLPHSFTNAFSYNRILLYCIIGISTLSFSFFFLSYKEAKSSFTCSKFVHGLPRNTYAICSSPEPSYTTVPRLGCE
ncbi:hypothetical protein BCE_3366 [Bacillus cereus ATCC 10987]|uniref:Uncharacterized protein n=1 Tax=Bacillus cereus (strain ATCC 10987 / NRS 248) TaxID=222523 RepID=Q734N8_BACC1|nr:hypothetical protein BCE_3366 [Bacillus cereus ATCC 10987]